MSFSIQEIDYALGENRISVEALCREVGRDYSKLVSRSGFIYVHHTSLESSEFFSNFLKEKLVLLKGDFVIFVNQSILEFIPGSSATVFKDVPESSAVNIIEVSDGCSGFARAIIMADALVSAHSAPRVHIVCAEKYSDYFTKSDSSVSPIFSDAISLCTIVPGDEFKIVKHETRNDFSQSEKISIQGSELADLKLEMEGSSVLAWSLSYSAEMVPSLLAEAELRVDEIDEWFLHQGSRIVVEMIGERLGIEGKELFTASEIGNTVSSSIPIALKERLKRISDEALGRNILLHAFGVGLSMTSVLLEAKG
ncbi:MAG: 3-oxoacyl-[acyl-carrier-protein] synthase III C-terminal domain-containing protein [Candidatus Nanopelagicaceae bacterium]|nr:3-oxoacyl-[acyl-carrier-protein] synthase III C-terminal domain-containing protein [Candidatus Nanopelagicaceae bacterium]